MQRAYGMTHIHSVYKREYLVRIATKQHVQVKSASVHNQNVWTHQATIQSARACCSSSVAEAVQGMNAELVPASEI